jgi:hypothetical protein
MERWVSRREKLDCTMGRLGCMRAKLVSKREKSDCKKGRLGCILEMWDYILVRLGCNQGRLDYNQVMQDCIQENGDCILVNEGCILVRQVVTVLERKLERKKIHNHQNDQEKDWDELEWPWDYILMVKTEPQYPSYH